MDNSEMLHIVCHPSDVSFMEEMNVHLSMLPKLTKHVAVVFASGTALADPVWREQVQNAFAKKYPPFILYVSEGPFEHVAFQQEVSGKVIERFLTDFRPINEWKKPLHETTRYQRDSIYTALFRALKPFC